MPLKLPQPRLAWSVTIAVATILGFVDFSIINERYAPLENYPDDTGAFLYGRPIPATLLAVFAFVSIAFGLWLLVRSLWQSPEAGVFARVWSACTLGLGIFLSIVAGPSFLRDADNLTVLGEAGITFYLNGRTETESWASLHHVELHCFGSRGGLSPSVTLRFTGGRAVPYVLAMQPVGQTRQEAWAVFETVRAQHSAPVIWRDLSQEMSFRERSPVMTRCANDFVNRFPVRSRATLLEMLSNGSGLREQ
jgi:hypothetical protein